ncbi:MAG: NADH:ubiquinone oxidoreductase subunit RnfG [Proteobacteria bacterium]|nr:RnfABCDGE type electron transport complex subunit G [bacterium AH-315-G11]PCI43896.1 MAG: NADH:ubiquinone oxidoreductase subunit RnfG [Pseudomonadota bacterium]
MKIDREQWQMVVALLVVGVVCTLLLATTNIFTKAPIAKAERQALMNALMQVLPEHQNDPIGDTRDITMNGDKKPTSFYFSRNKNNTINAIAWQVTAPDGYNGSIHILMAVHPDGTINAIRVTGHKETPGLGDGITKNHPWLNSFASKSLSNTRWAVKKDGGDFDQFTGATITPRAVVKAVKKGLTMYASMRDKLLTDSNKNTSEEAHAQ